MRTQWYIPLICVHTLVISSACALVNNVNITTVKGSGKLASEERPVSGFSRVVFSGIGELNLVQDGSESLTIEAEDNLLPLIESEVRNGVLYLGVKENTSLQPTKPLVFNLSVDALDGLESSGAGIVKAGDLSSETLDLSISGLGSLHTGLIQAERLAVLISGAGSVEIDGGSVSELKVDISGAGSLQAGDLQSENANLDLSGAGSATIWVTGSLDAALSGIGSINYYGEPTSITQEVSGVGGLKALGSK